MSRIYLAKYNECEEHVPDRRTLEDITQQSITNETILSYELWALKRMGWKLNGEMSANLFLRLSFFFNK